MDKAVAYIRASTGKQEISPELQLAQIKTYCTLKRLDLVEVIAESVSAKILLSKRPQGGKLARLVERGIRHVIAIKLDRLFRDAIDALTTTQEWDNAGVELHLTEQPIFNTGGSMGRFVLTMFAGFAELERNMISERTSAALGMKRKKGEKTGGTVPYGFSVKDGLLTLDPSEQTILGRLKSLREAGMSYSRIANEMNAEAIPSKTGGLWHPFVVQTVLGQTPDQQRRL